MEVLLGDEKAGRVVAYWVGMTERVAYTSLGLRVGLAGSSVVWLEVVTGTGFEAFGIVAVDGWVRAIGRECIGAPDVVDLSTNGLQGEKEWRASGAVRVVEGCREEVGYVEGVVVVAAAAGRWAEVVEAWKERLVAIGGLVG